MTPFEIVLDIEDMIRGEKRYYPEGNFHIFYSFRGFYHIILSSGEFHRSAQARSLYRHINKAINFIESERGE